MAMTKSERQNLNTALEYLNIFTNPNNPNCGVSAEVREAAKIYVDTWIGGPLRSIVQEEDEGGFIQVWVRKGFSSEVFRSLKNR